MRIWVRVLAACATTAVLHAAVLHADEFRISTGASGGQVFQRNAQDFADIALSGTAASKKLNGKDLDARLTLKGAVVPGFDWVPFAKIQKLRWAGEIKGVPTGGPYTLELRLPENGFVLPIENLLVGDLWILAGQSNMEGHGDLVNVQPPSEPVHSFDMAGRWVQAAEPLHILVNATDRVHWPLNHDREPEPLIGDALARYISERKKGAGLGLPFAAELARRTGVPIGLLPCAHGGTSMDQWSPALKDREGDSLYGSMLSRFRAVGGSVKGVLWYQGESDANPEAAPLFRAKFEALVKAMRQDFNAPDLPVYFVQIARHVNAQNAAAWNQVQEDQRLSETALPHTAMVAAVDLSLDDAIHIGTQDLKRLGVRLAKLACHDLFPASGSCGELKRGPRPVSATLINGVVKVQFTEVNGRLEAPGRISGFAIHDEQGASIPLIYRAWVDPAEASSVRLFIQGKLPDNATLSYGAGKDPYCNLTDAEDLAVPVFGPLPIR